MVTSATRRRSMTALRGVSAVCHLAAMVGLGVDFGDAPLYAGCNDLGTAVLLAAMARAGVRRLVLASSMVVYGEGAYSCAEHGLAATPPPRHAADLDAGRFEPRCERCGETLTSELVPEDAPLGPRNVYAATKVAQEHLAGSWARATAGQAVALRYHNVYGPGMPRDTPYAGVASFFRSALAAGRAPRVFEDGAQRRDFVHVRDVADATVAALDVLTGTGVPGGPGALRAYNVGSGTPRTVGQLGVSAGRRLWRPRPGDYRRVSARRRPARHRVQRAHLGGNCSGGRPCRSPRGSRSSPRRRPTACRPDGQAIQEQAGSLISKQQPASVFTTRTLPRWASTTPRTIARPRPAPLSRAGLRASVPVQARSKT